MTLYDRRSFLLTSGLLASAATVLPSCARQAIQQAPRPVGTRWAASPAIGLDACFAIIIAAAPETVLQVRHNLDRRDTLRTLMGAKALRSAETLIRALADTGRINTPGASLALIASPAPLTSIVQTVDFFNDPAKVLAAFEGTDFFTSDESKAELRQLVGPCAEALHDMAESDFVDWWHNTYKPTLDQSVRDIGLQLEPINVVREIDRYTTKTLDPNISVFVSELTRPHGIKIVGQRFITSPTWDIMIVRRNSVHEMLHILLPPSRPEVQTITDRLSADSGLQSVIEKSDSTFGYSSIRSLVEEGAVQALEAVINVRLDQARDVTAYWRKQDGGMHIFAAAMYNAMNRTGFAQRGGDVVKWLDEHTSSGGLQRQSLAKDAAAVVGEAHVKAWLA